MGCVAGAIGVSLFYNASNLAEFQAIQMWRIEWLLAATASFVAGILLKKPSDIDSRYSQRPRPSPLSSRSHPKPQLNPYDSFPDPAARRCWCMR